MFVENVGENYASADHNPVWTHRSDRLWSLRTPYLSDHVFFGYGWGNQTDFTQYFDYPGYGGVSWRHGSGAFVLNKLPTGGANTAFVDGHTRYFRPGGLAAGTNFSPNQSGMSVYQVDKSQYLWDPRN